MSGDAVVSEDEDSDHLYEKVPEEMLSEMRLNSVLHSLPEGVRYAYSHDIT